MVLTFGSKTAYGTSQSKYYEHRVHKSGNCELILQDLKTTDAGKYILKVYVNGQLLGSYIFDICVNGKVKTDLNIDLGFLLLLFGTSVYFILHVMHHQYYESVMPQLCFIVVFLFSSCNSTGR